MDEPPASFVEINRDELAARIGGCNLAFRELEIALDEKDPWTAARIEPLLDRLKILVMRHNDLNLYRELVPEEQRSSIERLASPNGAISQLAARIFEVRKQITGGDHGGSESQRQNKVRHLDQFSRTLAELAGE